MFSRGFQLVVVVFVSTVLTGLASAGQKPACTGWIAVESAPVESGVILLDGKEVGRSTPATLKDIPCGVHTVEAKKPEHAGSKIKVKVVDGEVVKAALDLRPNFAPLEITTNPTGAKLSLDGKDLGKAPVKIGKAAGGTYTLVARMPDYHEYTREFTLKPGKALKLAVVLKPAFGSLKVTAKPEKEANLFLDGDPLGTTPTTLSRVLAGVHTVRVEKEGYKPFQAKVKIREGKQSKLTAFLKTNFGTLAINSKPSGASVTVDGKDHGATPVTIRLSPGEHEVVLTGSSAASGKVTRKVRIRLRKKHKLHVKMPMRVGSLMVDTIPFAAKIEMDGKKMGKAPLSLKSVPVGTHVLVATVKGKPPLIGRIEVIEGKKATAEMNIFNPNKSVYNSGGIAKVVKKPAEKPKPVPKPLSEAKPEPEEVAKARKETGPEFREKKKPEPPSPKEPASEVRPKKPAPKIAAKTEEPKKVVTRPPTVTKRRPMSTQRLLAWISTGTAGAAAVTSVILFATGASVQTEADEAWDQGDRTRAQDLDVDAANLKTGGLVSLVVAGAFAGSAVYFFLTEPDAPSSSTAMLFTPLPGGGWVGIEGRF